MNPPSSQIASHLNKVPIKIQSLSLLIGFGSDRQPELWCLFRFHFLVIFANSSLGHSTALKPVQRLLFPVYNIPNLRHKTCQAVPLAWQPWLYFRVTQVYIIVCIKQ